ncbi:threonine ammonia-lyase [Chytriomyces confervae]|uniref:threonine ammonia-lyase n=1 Tax=Chytriomyces confervae TaxID=246404 RepID=A0A507CXA7_9FUNG|nr:threonine ammonia-lyase [Chytriomyces confervae]
MAGARESVTTVLSRSNQFVSSQTNLFEWPEPSIPAPAPMEDAPELDYLQMILNARVYDVASETPLQLASKLSAKVGNKIFLKREDMQPIFSFKIRGAYNRMYHLSKDEKSTGVICASAGNQLRCTSVTTDIPGTNPENVGQCARSGPCSQEAGNTCDDCYAETRAGNQSGKYRLDAIFVCCGGGGMLAGIATFVKRIRPEVKIIGVNAADSDSMFQSLHQGAPVEIPQAGLFADGTSVRLVGAENYRLCRSFVDDFVLVSTDEVCAAIKDTFDDTRSIIEPAGALAVAGIKKFLSKNPHFRDAVFVGVVSGANMNFDRLRFVAERARLGDGREALISVKIPERPGSFLELYGAIDPRPVTEFSYRYISDLENDVNELLEKLSERGMEARDVSHDEMAKTHLRYLAGGRSSTVKNEVLYRFQFPERPGALKKFLNHLEGKWNVSLFHYRNHGADIARVLVGLEVPEADRSDFGARENDSTIVIHRILGLREVRLPELADVLVFVLEFRAGATAAATAATASAGMTSADDATAGTSFGALISAEAETADVVDCSARPLKKRTFEATSSADACDHPSYPSPSTLRRVSDLGRRRAPRCPRKSHGTGTETGKV